MSDHPAAALARSGGAGGTWGAIASAAFLLAAFSAAGCSGGGSKPAATTLAPSDFQRPPAPVAATEPTAQPAEPAPTAPPAQRPTKPIRMIAVSEAMQGVIDVSTIPGPPPESQREAPPETTDTAFILDSKVGEINGRPIFASAFLEPLDGRLRALAQEAAGDQRRWERLAAEVIANALNREIIDELLLAEAHAAIPREHREVGLRAFMQQFQQDMARHNQGSIAAADERLRREEGLSLDEKSRQELDRALIKTHLQQRVVPRIQVSARDQRDYYERNFDEFNPPGNATLRLIRVRADNEAGVAAVRSALESGTPFAEVAALEANGFNHAGGGIYSVTINGPVEEADFIAIEELNKAARTLEVGRHTGPVAAGESVWWVMLERIDRPDATSFYDAQLEINRRLFNHRSDIEQARYLHQLKSKGSYTDVDETVHRLLNIATARYFGRS